MGGERNVSARDVRVATPGDNNVIGNNNVVNYGSPSPSPHADERYPSPWGLPDLPDGEFLGREAELRRLHKLLSSDEAAVALTARRVAAYGGGGLGKTRLAVEYAYRHLEDYPGGIFFTPVGESEPLQVWAELGRQLFVRELLDDEAAAAAVLGHLKEEGGAVLVILDDVAGDAGRFAGQLRLGDRRLNALPTAPWVSMLMTTRLGAVAGARSWPVERLAREAAVALLGERAGRRMDELGEAEREMAVALADEDLGGHALALALAGSYLRKTRSLSFGEYRKKLHRRGSTALLEEAARHARNALTDHERSIVATFEFSLALLAEGSEEDTLARRLLELAAFLASGVAIDR